MSGPIQKQPLLERWLIRIEHASGEKHSEAFAETPSVDFYAGRTDDPVVRVTMERRYQCPTCEQVARR